MVLPDKIACLRKNSNRILQLQMKISFKKQQIYFELYNKLFNARHISLQYEKRNSIETLKYLVISG